MTKRRQQQIPGTERTAHTEVDEAADALVETQKEAAQLREKASSIVEEAHAALVQRMLDAKLAVYKYLDADGDVAVVKVVVPDSKATVKKTGEREIEIGQGVEVEAAPSEDTEPAVSSRRVRRTVEHEAAADPFGATRKAME